MAELGNFQSYKTVPTKKGFVFAGKVGMRDGVETEVVYTRDHLMYECRDSRLSFDSETGILWFNPRGKPPIFDIPLDQTAVIYDLSTQTIYHLNCLSPESYLQEMVER